ncbi:hypothetical protein CEXT_368301 [Caerostris extrusa]|uniref:Uncharacterized protein n=1 Tax=Caerostris extrusa TaxID=172846 RepID=A0AAV4WIP3_CAEEX|nr:hypothetical protein CEXT_368301 [Caerostris extrusa]
MLTPSSAAAWASYRNRFSRPQKTNGSNNFRYGVPGEKPNARIQRRKSGVKNKSPVHERTRGGGGGPPQETINSGVKTEKKLPYGKTAGNLPGPG